MIDPGIKSALLDEVRYWPGATLDIRSGGKHAAVYVIVNDVPQATLTTSCTSSDHRAAANIVGDLRRVLREAGAKRVGKDEALAIKNDRHAEYLRRRKIDTAPKTARRKLSRNNIAQLAREIQADRRRPLLLPHRERKISKKGVDMTVTAMKEKLSEALAPAHDGVPPGCRLPYRTIDRTRVFWRLVDEQGRNLGERQTYDELINEREWPEGVAGIEFIHPEDDQ